MDKKKTSPKKERRLEKEFEEILHEVEEEQQKEAESASEGYEIFALSSEVENEILMHRDVHFSGSFETMLEYYRTEGKGVQPAFSIAMIEKLSSMEKEGNQNLAVVLLTGAEIEKVARARDAYKKTRHLYESAKDKNSSGALIASLIFSEEGTPQAEIDAIVAQKSAIVPALIELIRSEEFYDPLFPGYGFAPMLAAKCLGLIGDKRGIMTLFEAMNQGDFFSEEVLIKSLKAIGQPAKEFLLKVVHGQPYNEDNEKAALALLEFKEDPLVSQACFDILKGLDVKKNPVLATYLVLVCDGLADPHQREELINMSQDPKWPSMLKRDVETVMKRKGNG